MWFADSIELEALVNCDRKLRVLTSQPHIVGEPAEYDEIRRWFAALGFERLDIHDRIAWYRVEGNLLIADAHEGNLIKTEAGVLVPIDLNILQPNAAMLAEVQRFRVA